MAIPESNGKTVLITGINGYIAGVLGQLLLTKGYSLRGTTRRAASVEPLLKGAYAPYKDRIQIIEVSDMTKSGAFDEAAKGWLNLGMPGSAICANNTQGLTAFFIQRRQLISVSLLMKSSLTLQWPEMKVSLVLH
jgi:nucleoside-diphosphate-sugar epimerase